jgi:hypothetical protein
LISIHAASGGYPAKTQPPRGAGWATGNRLMCNIAAQRKGRKEICMKTVYVVDGKEIDISIHPVIREGEMKLYETRDGYPVYIMPDGITKIKANAEGCFHSAVYDPRLKMDIFEGDIYYMVDCVMYDDNGEVYDREMYGVSEYTPDMLRK